MKQILEEVNIDFYGIETDSYDTYEIKLLVSVYSCSQISLAMQ